MKADDDVEIQEIPLPKGQFSIDTIENIHYKIQSNRMGTRQAFANWKNIRKTFSHFSTIPPFTTPYITPLYSDVIICVQFCMFALARGFACVCLFYLRGPYIDVGGPPPPMGVIAMTAMTRVYPVVGGRWKMPIGRCVVV